MEVGLVSIQAASDSDLFGHACLSPYLSSAGNTGGHRVGGVINLGSFAGVPSFPTFLIVVGNWSVSLGTGLPNTVDSTIGTAGAGPVQSPLLANVIFEIQGPVGGAGSTQYFVATTHELTGTRGGVANGNPNWGANVFGAPTAVTGAHAHTRLILNDDVGIGGQQLGVMSLGAPGRTGMLGHVAFETPFLWATNDGSEGAGGADWRIQTAPVSVVDVRVEDMLAGAAVGGPCLDPVAFNQALVVVSGRPAATMPQGPFSWDDLGGAVPPQAGGVVIGALQTARQGPQTVPCNVDLVTAAVLQLPGLALTSPFQAATPATPGSLVTAHFFEGTTGPLVMGTARLSGGPVPVAGRRTPHRRRPSSGSRRSVCSPTRAPVSWRSRRCSARSR